MIKKAETVRDSERRHVFVLSCPSFERERKKESDGWGMRRSRQYEPRCWKLTALFSVKRNGEEGDDKEMR